MAEIIPAVMPIEYIDVQDASNQVAGLVSFVQIDVMDGVFVQDRTWPRQNDDVLQSLIEQKRSLPNWERIDYEVDLMVSNPEEVAEQWFSAGAARVIVHSQSSDDYKGIVERLSNTYAMPGNLVSAEVGIAVPFDADVSVLEGIAEYVSVVQVMGISPVGVQGSEFKPRALQTISEFREVYPDLAISVDGGVKPELMGDLISAGVNRIVMGSAIFDTDVPRDELKNILKEVDVIE